MRPEFRFGLAAGLAAWLWLALEEVLGFHTTRLQAGDYGTWVLPLIQLAMLGLLLRDAHRREPLGRLEPWHAAVGSLLTSVVFAVLLYAGLVATLQFVNPGWLDRMLVWKVGLMRAHGIHEDIIRTFIVATREAYSPLGLARTCFLLCPLAGMAAGLVFCIALNLTWERAHLARP